VATQQNATPVLSSEERERFERDGYLIFDPEISEETLDAVLRDAGNMYRYEGENHVDEREIVYGAGLRPRVMDAWKASENVKALALAPKVLAVCEGLYGRKVLPFQTLNFPIGTQQLAHADAMHFNSEPAGFMCGVWIALEDMDMDNGPLVYFPGSQEMPLPTWDQIEGEDTERYPNWDTTAFVQSRGRRYEQHVQKQIERDDLKPDYGIMRKGEALLWAARLLHGGSPQKDPDRSRHSQVTHYYFEGSRYNTPMWSQNDSFAFWRHPWWIREEGFKDEDTALRETVNTALPGDAKAALLGQGEEVELDGRTARAFLPADDQESGEPPGDAVRKLEQLRADGVEYLIVPRRQQSRLNYRWNWLQQHLEDRYRALVRDGGSCTIYDLRNGASPQP
jgi:ectoine hydroxylase-related dioxygenase (phytanoyl-CoA dioxygenase family)